MPVYSCRVARSDGTVSVERIEAENVDRAKARLQELGYLIFSIRPRLTDWTALFRRRSHRFGHQEFLVFNQELSALLKAGVPILKSVELLVDRTGHAEFQSTLREVRDRVKGGAALSEAMGQFPRYFPELYVASLRSGEQTGNIVEMVSRYMAFLRRMIAVRGKIRSAMTYPLFLMTVGIGVIGFLLLYVVPSFSEVYREAQVELPLLTRGLLALISALRHRTVWLIAGGVAAAAIASRFLVKGWWPQDWIDRWILHLPVIGESIRMHHVIGLTRTLSTTLSGGIPLVPALRMVRASMTNRLFADRVAQVTDEVTSGSGLAHAMERARLLPRMSIEMVEIGETAGALPEMLAEVAEFHEGELDRLLQRLMTWIEPVILIMMGGVVALIVIAMYLPIFYLAGTIH